MFSRYLTKGCALFALIATAGVAPAEPLGTAFTYQGQLKQNGSAVNGTADLSFTLWDDATATAAANKKGGPLSFPAQSVTNGLFVVQLDFTAAALNGTDARWLEVTVNGNTLTPRERLFAVPFALQTRGITVDASNHVGVGTPSPKTLLDASGTIRSTSQTVPTAGAGTEVIYNGGQGYLTSYDRTGGKYMPLHADGSTLILNAGSGGSVGIGTSDPGTAKLKVQGNTGSPAIYGQASGGPLAASVFNEGVLGLATGNNGIGVHGVSGVRCSLNGCGLKEARGVVGESGTNTGVEGGSDSGWGVNGHSKTGPGVFGTSLSDVGVAGACTNATGWGGHFWNGQSDQALLVDGRTVTKCLDINGGCDLAESFDVAGGGTKPGMVMVIDSEHAGKLKVASKPYDHKVAGVISGAGGINTGMVLSQPGAVTQGDHKVALTGRVYCLCDASFGAIEAGDLLTTSSTPGHAMKATDRDKAFGAVIGKAMTELKKGKGLVLVLVQPQ